MVSVTGESRAGLKKAVEKRMASSNGLPQNAGKRSMPPKPSVTKSSGLNGKAGKGNMLPEMRMSKNPGVNAVETPTPSTCSSGLPRMKKNGGVLLTKKGMDSQLLHEKSPMSQSLLSKLQTRANEFSSTVKSFSEEMGSDARRDAGKFGRDDYNFRRFEARMMTELQEIKASIQALSLKIDSLPAREDKDEEVQLLHDLPLQRLEDLTEFQEAVRSNIK
ncbi:uncharacterized protein LOC124161437 [Ischnura elegans]|uniref:uncharacterized protein LOC124161437 n=1 Tax=Ischnura elegans TaxID=197161 RepID=UPI001ED89F8C|nr:uncharacterized protein LOC124161437 [Ischnura elegans]